MEVGKLYSVSQYFWFLYPSRDIVAAAAEHPAAVLDAAAATRVGISLVVVAAYASAPAAAASAAYWSKRLDCNVSYISPKSMIMLLEQDKEYCKVLTTSGELGWIIIAKRYNDCFEEVKAE